MEVEAAMDSELPDFIPDSWEDLSQAEFCQLWFRVRSYVAVVGDCLPEYVPGVMVSTSHLHSTVSYYLSITAAK